MKKVILNLSLLVLIMATVSCKNDTKSDSTADAEVTEQKTEEKAEKSSEKENTTAPASDDVPSFSDQAVQDYVNSYEAYIEEYKKVVESKDMTAFASLGQKGQELGQKAQEVMGNLSGDDIKKLNDYMQKKSTQLQELSKKLMQ
ncbi:hypothetical protein [Aquimarina sp. 2201CG5-10]|uniref:hypothetical protein n=1 Tax=Aquimarina callyspongiae TaxID=3098150 RepID=UPI002AB36154|nr:hypothetical protein [Aquimarina sp. 2201CG5-10]MDY8137994.1 hypothetical protein [Aquimarina sp. 2201CG5-10]